MKESYNYMEFNEIRSLDQQVSPAQEFDLVVACVV